MSDPVKVYKAQKKVNWINYQLAQRLIVFCYIDSHLIVIKRAKVEDESVVINGDKNLKLKTQPIYSTKADITNPIGTFRDKPLTATESADLICKCIW